MGNAFDKQEGILNKALRENEGDAKKVLSDPEMRWHLYKLGTEEAFHLRALAQLWLEELQTTGLQQLDRTSGAPLKEHWLSPEPPSVVPSPSRDSVYPAREDSGQVLWVKLVGHKHIEILDQPTRMDTALFAALTALEVSHPPIDTESLREGLRLIDPPLTKWIEDYLVTNTVADDDWPETLEELLKPADFEEWQRRQLETPEGKIVVRLGYQVRALAYVVALLRHFRPDFDSLSQIEQIALIEQASAHINEFLDALRKFVAFLEYGMPSGLPNQIRENAQTDVTAAVLKDVDGLSNTQIGKRFGIAPTPADQNKGDHSRARKMVKRGRKILELALGKEGWQKHIEAMRAEAARWRSLSEEEREDEEIAEAMGKPIEEVRREGEEVRRIEQEARRREAER